MRASFLLCCFFALSACGSKVKKAESSFSGSGAMSPYGAPLVSVGENYSPHFSRDENRFLFISAKRSSHRQPQVYEFDLKTKKERRITFQDGEVQSPIYLDADWIAYASTTDELKERPIRLGQQKASPSSHLGELLPSELYASDRFGEKIVRVTKTPGFDGYPYFQNSKAKRLVFSRQVGPLIEIWESPTKPSMGRRLYASDNAQLTSPKWNEVLKSWLWLERPVLSKTSYLMMAQRNFREVRAIDSLPPGNYNSFEISSDGLKLVFSADLKLSERPQLYVFDFLTKCLETLIEGPSAITEPSLSPNGKDLLFVADWAGGRQVFKAQVDLNSKKCLTSPKSEEKPLSPSVINR